MCAFKSRFASPISDIERSWWLRSDKASSRLRVRWTRVRLLHRTPCTSPFLLTIIPWSLLHLILTVPSTSLPNLLSAILFSSELVGWTDSAYNIKFQPRGSHSSIWEAVKIGIQRSAEGISLFFMMFYYKEAGSKCKTFTCSMAKERDACYKATHPHEWSCG